MSDEMPTIRFVSSEKNTSAHDKISIWRISPEKVERHGVKYYGDQICWLGSVSDLLYTYTVTEFIALFGHDILPPSGECLKIKITR